MGASHVHRVLVVEDSPATQRQLVRAVESHAELCLAGAAGSLRAARALLESCGGCDVALVDLGLPDGNGMSLIPELVRRKPAPQVLVITVFGDERHVVGALELGAVGYLLKENEPADVAAAILAVIHGESPISPSIARHLLKRLRTPQPAASAPPASPRETPMSARETEVLTLVAKGLTHKEIAGSLGVSVHTITTHVRHIYRKLSVNSRSEAVYEALQLGIVDL